MRMPELEKERRDVLLNSKAGCFEGRVVCPRCEGFGVEPRDSDREEEAVCRLCKGWCVVVRQVKIQVQDRPVRDDE